MIYKPGDKVRHKETGLVATLTEQAAGLPRKWAVRYDDGSEGLWWYPDTFELVESPQLDNVQIVPAHQVDYGMQYSHPINGWVDCPVGGFIGDTPVCVRPKPEPEPEFELSAGAKVGRALTPVIDRFMKHWRIWPGAEDRDRFLSELSQAALASTPELQIEEESEKATVADIRAFLLNRKASHLADDGGVEWSATQYSEVLDFIDNGTTPPKSEEPEKLQKVCRKDGMIATIRYCVGIITSRPLVQCWRVRREDGTEELWKDDEFAWVSPKEPEAEEGHECSECGSFVDMEHEPVDPLPEKTLREKLTVNDGSVYMLNSRQATRALGIFGEHFDSEDEHVDWVLVQYRDGAITGWQAKLRLRSILVGES